MSRDETRATVLRLGLATTVFAAGYLGLCVWTSDHLPASVAVGGVQVGGSTHDEAVAAIDRAAAPLLERPITVSVPGTEHEFEVVPGRAGFTVDAAASIAGLTGFTVDPATVWSKLNGRVEAPLVTHHDDVLLSRTLEAEAARSSLAPIEGSVSFEGGKVSVSEAEPGHELDVVGTRLAIRRAFPRETQVDASTTPVPPEVGVEAIRRAAKGFAATAVSGPVTVTVGKTSVRIAPEDFDSALSMRPDGAGGLEPVFDEERLAAIVADRVDVATRAPKDARWTFKDDRPHLEPSVDGIAVDAAELPGLVAAAIGSTDRTVTIAPKVTRPRFTTEEATKAGITEVVVDFRSPFPAQDTTRTRNLVVATKAINGTYIPPGGTFSLNGVLGERTTEKGYADGTVIIDGRLTRGTGGGISQVSTVMYNLAYFAGADILEFRPHAFFIPRYPEGREATVYWPTIDNRFRNDTPYGMLLQTWVEGDEVRGRVWSTKTWDIRSVKSERRNVVEPEKIKDDSPTCYPQQPNPGFDVTVTRQWYRPGSSVLVKSEDVTTHYVPEHEVVCTNPEAKRRWG